MVSFLIVWEQAVQCINLGFFGLVKYEVILNQNLDILETHIGTLSATSVFSPQRLNQGPKR